MLRILVIPLMFLATSSRAADTPDIDALIAHHEEQLLCLVLLSNGSMDQFGLQLQFEIDSEFYSKENRELYLQNFGKLYNAEFDKLGYKNLTPDQNTYLKQKIHQSSMQLGIEWGMKSTMSGISSWDGPFRNCVNELNLSS
jgi:hypothetical protein